jgi:hypothetical protein
LDGAFKRDAFAAEAVHFLRYGGSPFPIITRVGAIDFPRLLEKVFVRDIDFYAHNLRNLAEQAFPWADLDILSCNASLLSNFISDFAFCNVSSIFKLFKTIHQTVSALQYLRRPEWMTVRGRFFRR